MNTALHILHLEDDADYAELVRATLDQDGLNPHIHWVNNEADFLAALERDGFDVILADYSLPSYNGLAALDAALRKCPDTPFLLVSGAIGEQAAIESLRRGVTDYVLKQNAERLLPAVRRALQEAEERRTRRRTEGELARREAYFRALTENALDVLSILDREGVFQYHSASVQRVLGYEPLELLGRSAFDLVHPEDKAAVRQAFAYGLQHPHVPVTVEYRFHHKDGSWRHIEAIGQNHLDDPDIGGVVVNSRDVTERRRAERQAAALAQLGRSLSMAVTQEAAAHLIAEVADDLLGWDLFILQLWDEAAQQVIPLLAVDEIDGRRTELPLEDISRTPSALARRIVERGAELIVREPPIAFSPETTLIGDKSRPSASLMFVPIRSHAQVIAILSIQSYTPRAYAPVQLEMLQALADHCGGALERIRAEQALRETQERFAHLFENSPDAIFVEDFTGQVLDANPAACRLHGLERQQLVGRNVLELVPPENREETRTGFQRLVRGEESRLESLSYAADGQRVPVELRTSRIEYAGRPALLLHVRDLTERKRTESALQESELLFRSVWENSVDGMRLTDEQGTMVAVNEAFCKLVGLPREQLEGRPYTVIYDESENHARLLQKYRERFRDRIIERQIQRRLTLHNGAVMELEDTNSFVELPGKAPLLLGLFRDLTAQKRLEEQLRQSQKMDAIGQLAGGVAHDFNNVLTVIQGHASLLLAAGQLPEPAARSAEQITQAAERAARLTRQLLTFSRRQVVQTRRLDLNETVASATKMFGRILGEDVTLQLAYWPQPATVLADAGMLEQVILNLSVNARDAMPKGGQLSLRVAVVEVNADQVAQHPGAREGRFVCLTTSDTGCGIAPENLPRIFEPFFTTKKVGKGTGLGLATVYGIVKQHEGWIEVESVVGRGTAFRVYLPQAEGRESNVEGVEKTPEAPVRGGTETLLVVEDEALVRELISNILLGRGYEVLQAASGPTALQIWATRKHDIQLLLTDMVMPDRLNGWELAERLWQDRPDLKVIFTSGYSDDVVGREFVPRAGLHYLQKPFQPQALASVVRDVLDNKTPARSAEGRG